MIVLPLLAFAQQGVIWEPEVTVADGDTFGYIRPRLSLMERKISEAKEEMEKFLSRREMELVSMYLSVFYQMGCKPTWRVGQVQTSQAKEIMWWWFSKLNQLAPETFML